MSLSMPWSVVKPVLDNLHGAMEYADGYGFRPYEIPEEDKVKARELIKFLQDNVCGR